MFKKLINSFDEIPVNAKISIYGAGGAGLHFKKKLEQQRNDVKVSSFIDSFKKGNLDGLPIIKFDDSINSGSNNDLIIISSTFWEDIEKVLKVHSINNYLVDTCQYSDLFIELLKYFYNDLDLNAPSIKENKCVAKFEYFLEKENPETVLEIGTNTGSSAVLMAKHSQKVITLDIEDFKVKDRIWKHFDVQDKIEFIQVADNEVKKEIVDSLDFDFAFVDGDHTYEGVSFDFDITKKCGKVLFHDYDYWHHFGGKKLKSIKEFVDTLPIKNENSVLELRNPFAFWKTL